MSAEEALHFGLIPRQHRGIFAMNELPDLDELVQVGLFNILEERDVQIRGYPVRFDLDILVLFSANPATYNRSGKVIPQLKDRIGSTIQTHYPRDRTTGIEITRQEAAIDLGGAYPVMVPPFMEEIVEEIARSARKSRLVDQASGVSARFAIANYRTMVANARRRAITLGERPAVPRISDLGHLQVERLGKLELDLMGIAPDDRAQVIDAVDRRGDRHGLRGVRRRPRPDEIVEVFAEGVRDRGGRHAAVEAYETALGAACRRRGRRPSR